MPVLDSTSVMELEASLPTHSGDVYAVAVSDGVIATASGDKVIRVFNSSDLTEKSYSPLHIHKYHVIRCVITRAGDRLISTSMDGKASVVDLGSGKLLSLYSHPRGMGMRSCCVSDSGQLMAAGAVDGTITVLEMETYKPLKSMSMNDDESILALTFTPDSHWLISGHSVTGDLRVWNSLYLSNKYSAYMMGAHEGGVYCLDMMSTAPADSAEDDHSARISYTFASGGEDCMVRLWQITYEEHDSNPQLSRLQVLLGHTSPVYCVQFSKDGLSLVSCGGDQTLRLWNMEGECMYVHVNAHKSADDRLVYSASSDRQVNVWRVTDVCSLTAAAEGDPGADIESSQQRAGHISADQAASAKTRGSRTERLRISDVMAWSVDDVCDWLNRLGLSKYCQTFRRNEMDGRELLQLSHSVLQSELGVEAFGTRNKIVQGIEELLITRSSPAHTEKTTPSAPDTDGFPNEFLCPITRQLMSDPVVAADGYSYERKAIESWFSKGNTRSPMTNMDMGNRSLIHNLTLRALIHRQLQQ